MMEKELLDSRNQYRQLNEQLKEEEEYVTKVYVIRI